MLIIHGWFYNSYCIKDVEGSFMSRIISHEGPGKVRGVLTKAIVAGIRQLAKREKFDDESKDIISFIILSLEEITQSVEKSVVAWEKRNYWIKADKFRMEWAWSSKCSQMLRTAYMENDLFEMSKGIAEVGKYLSYINISDRNRIGTPWKGYRNRLA